MPKDNIPDVGTDVGRQLFHEYVRISKERPVDDVIAASLNMILNCLRQHVHSRHEAETKMKEIFGRGMEVLLQHYDPTTGRKRSVIPFDQVVRPDFMMDDDTFIADTRRRN